MMDASDENNKNEMRINRYIAAAGVCSRRKADEMIASGEVTIDGKVAVTGQKITLGQELLVRGKAVHLQRDYVYLLLNKPRGITCTASRKDPDNVIDFLSFEHRVFPVGRLDKLSTGLLLLTNDGETAHLILRTDGFHEKEYRVRVDRPVDDHFIRLMSTGIPILEKVTLPCFVEKTGDRTFTIILTQGLNRQIRRMCEYLGYRVMSLQRTRIMNLEIGDLPVGKWRYLTPEEIAELKSALDRASPGTKQTSPDSNEVSRSDNRSC